MPELTFRHNGGSSMSGSKQSSYKSNTRSQAQSIFKEKYDKNIEKYLNTINYNRYNIRKNVSNAIGQLMSPEFTTSKDRRFDL